MFDNSLIESTHRKEGNRKAMSLPVSVAIHGLVIGALLGASIWFVGDVPEPPIPVTFYAAAPPPPPPPPAPPKAPPPHAGPPKPGRGQARGEAPADGDPRDRPGPPGGARAR